MSTLVSSRLRRPIAGAVIAACASLAISGCSKQGGGQASISLARGESVEVVLEVKAGESEGGELESCDLVVLNEQDPDTALALEQVDVTFGKPSKTADRRCGAIATLDAHDDAVPGDYVVEATFFYEFSSPFQGTQEGDDFGSILVTLTP